jgi:hypothetical protein
MIRVSAMAPFWFVVSTIRTRVRVAGWKMRSVASR